jgi:hypothetical protein
MDFASIALDAVEPETLIYDGTLYVQMPENVWIRIANPSGVGSGWPIVEVFGERDAVIEYVKDHWGEEALEAYDVYLWPDSNVEQI